MVKDKTPEIEDLEEEDLKSGMETNLDIIKHGLDVHSKESNISKDYILFKSNEKDREFIRNMFKLAFLLRMYILDKEVAKEVYNLIISETIIIAVLKRNEYENPILSALFANAKEKEDETLIDTLKQKILPSKEN